MAQKPWIVSIPGTGNMDHLNENLGAVDVKLTSTDLREIETGFSRIEIYGGRMDARQMAQIGQVQRSASVVRPVDDISGLAHRPEDLAWIHSRGRCKAHVASA